MRAQIAAAAPDDPLWQHAAAVLAQFDGLQEGLTNCWNPGKSPDSPRTESRVLASLRLFSATQYSFAIGYSS